MSGASDLDGIAIIGLAGRFPGSRSPAELWRNLREGVESVSFFAPPDVADLPVPAGGHLVFARGVLADIDLFDADLFGYPPGIAAAMDPQHRLFLESAWEALESGGYDPGAYPGAIGVFAGCSRNSYFLANLLSRPDVLSGLGPHQVATVSDSGFLATRVSYKLNLRGPSLTVQTTCSTSLVAVHLACQSLLNGECDLALAGGVAVAVPQESPSVYREGGIFSPDGHCRAFDARASGTVSGSGVGVVLLRRLSDALADGDPVRAVLLGSAVNNDGAEKVGYTAPGIEGQAAVISEALTVAGVDPGTVSYVETHGTGTTLGDPIEIAALTQAFRSRTDRRGFCAIGSVKTNLGHLDEAAGVTGLIKTVLMLEHGEIPPSLHFETPHPDIPFAASPFFVNDLLRAWDPPAGPRRAGVSSFGLGGTNAHAVLEEAPPPPPPGPARPWQLLVLSARTPSALDAATANLAEHLGGAGVHLPDAAFTLQTGRKTFAHRRFAVCRDPGEAAEALRGLIGRHGPPAGDGRSAVFLFPGQGSQEVDMARGLYETEAGFRESLDRDCERLRPLLGRDLRELLFPSPERRDEAVRELDRTLWAQPVLFVVELALAELWMEWGVRPRALIGHSLGEWVAACLAGVFSREDTLALVAARAQMMDRLPAGAMLAVSLSEDETVSRLPAGVSLAAVNAAERCVVSGPRPEIDELVRRLDREEISHRRLRTSHAFHSALVEPALAPFAERVAAARRSPALIPFVSNVTGTWITPEQATSPEYWAQHLRSPVRFRTGLETLLADLSAVPLEVGPGKALASLARRAAGRGRPVLASLESGSGPAALLDALGGLWAAGVPVDWTGFSRREVRRRVPLPTYPFERRRHWIEPAAAAPRGTGEPVAVAPVAAAPPAREGDRPARIRKRLAEVLGRLFGLTPGDLDPQTPFAELGADSLLLLQANEAIQREFGIKLSFFQLLEECPTLEALAAFLDARLPANALPPDPPAVPEAPAPAVPARPAEAPAEPALQRIVEQQIELNTLLLQVLRGRTAEASPAPPARSAAVPALAPPATRPVTRFPFDPVPAEEGAAGLTELQRTHLEALAARYTARTRESKRRTEAHRLALADNRNSVGFRTAWKELVYPIQAERSRGSRIWDVDGNEYIDLTMGFGVFLFGHGPDFLREAVLEQMERGIHVGPQSDLAGEVAELLSRVAGVERVTFCNTGTEAVMTALRVARAVTGRSRVALFSGSYHGSFDGTLFNTLAVGTKTRVVPRAPGVPASFGTDLLVLDYATPESLDAIAAEGDRLAAVLVEPVQSRRPDLQPREYLHELRRLTERHGTALIFDETISGFRPHPRGARGWFGVDSDLVTYGKVVGGGMPIGVMTGRSRFMDAIDGGPWRFGDASTPEVAKTFFAGTFCKHPLAMVSARAVLRRLQQEGEALQQGLNHRAAALVERMNALFARREAPFRIVHFGSQMLFTSTDGRSDLLFYHLAERGVYLWEGRTCFLSTAHTGKDLDRTVVAVEESLDELQEAGFFVPPGVERVPASRLPRAGAAERRVPLTPAQQQLWVESQIGPDASSAYNQTLTLRLEGPLDRGRLAAALERLADRHESLRTRFSSDGDFQIVEPRIEIALELFDTREHEGEAGATLAAWRRAQEREPFDLGRTPLLRAGLALLADESHLLVLTAHHLIIDGWSLGVLIREAGFLYSGAEGSIPPPPRYSDYAQRVREADHAPVYEESRRFWLAEYAEALPPLDLPLDWPRAPIRPYEGRQLVHRIAPRCLQAVREASRQQGCTSFVFLLAGFTLLLHRLTGQDDVGLAIPSAGQTFAGAERLVGFCVNVLPVRSRLAGRRRFSEHLGGIKRSFIRAYEHQDFPFGRLLEELRIPPDPSRPPLVSVLFNRDQTLPVADSEVAGGFAGVSMEIVPALTYPTEFELKLDVLEAEGELLVPCIYRIDLFEAATVQRWLRQYESLLGAVAADPDALLEDPLWLSPEERHQLLLGWNDTPVLGEPPRFLHHAFERQAQGTPEALALWMDGDTLSYGELNRRANRLAHYLRWLGAGPDVRVAIYLERSFELIVSILAILKAGGAYVPIDPRIPADRQEFLLADSRAAVLIGLEAGAPMPGAGMARTVLLDRAAALIAAQPDRDPVPVGDPGNAAYVLYTSGTTGRPKGTVIPHRSGGWYVAMSVPFLRITPADRVLQFTSPSFDVSVGEIFTCLSSGATLVLATPDMKDPEVFLAQCARAGVTVTFQTPALWHEISLRVEAEPSLLPSSLRLVLSAGDRLSRERVASWWRRVGEAVTFVNACGPTETSIICCAMSLTGLPPGELPIGRTLQGVRLYVVDAAGQLVPTGAPGEMWIGGPGVSRGYLGRPDLTAERFVPDDFSGLPGERLYRSGDRVRWLADGSFDFLGRIDLQVKIRGFRIEPGEVESTLGSHPEVRQAAVVLREDRPGERRLVAWVSGSPELRTADLRHWLQLRLPEYMVPAKLVTLPALPLNANGKIDRRALATLPLAEEAEPVVERLRDPVEEALAEIWADLLPGRTISADSDFFLLGGDSLLATRLLSRLRQVFRAALTLREVFEEPRLRHLATRITAAHRTVAGEAPPLVARPRSGDAPLSFAQQRLWLIDRLQPGAPAYNLPAALRLAGSLDAAVLAGALSALVRRHEALRTVFPEVAGEPVQRVLPPRPVPLSQVDLRAIPETLRAAESRRLAAEEALAPFDLEHGPVLRAQLLRLDEREHVLCLTLHHIAGDGWSVDLFLGELTAVYEAIAAGAPSPLPPLPIQYADYAAWQRGWLCGAALSSEVAFWKERLAGALPRLELPADRPRPAVPSGRGGAVPRRFSPELLPSLKGLARRSSASLFMVLTAASEALLGRYARQDDFCLGTPMAGRDRLELEPLIGFFVNTLVLRADLAGAGPFRELVERVRGTVLEAHLHQALPFEKLVEELAPERDLSMTPLFQVVVQLERAREQEVRLGGAEVLAEAASARTAKFDLHFAFLESGDGLACTLVYNSDLFEAATVGRLLGHLETLLREAGEREAEPWTELLLLTVAERDEILGLWPAVETGAPGSCLHERFREQARRRPGAVALVDGASRWTYGELDRASDLLAWRLRDEGVGPERFVALLLERSARLVVSILGVLKAGGAYVPLDPDQPAERLGFALCDSGAAVLLVEDVPPPGLAGPLPPVVRLGDPDPEGPGTPPAAGTLADNAAYAIYTSGSTGRPKGVVVTHANVLRLFAATRESFGFGEEDVWTLFHSYAFDFSVWEIWGALLYGGRLVVVPSQTSRAADAFRDLLVREGVTVLNQTPSAFRALDQVDREAPIPELSLRSVIFGGEALEPSILDGWFERHGDERPRLVNMYGITETTVHVTYRPLGQTDTRSAARSPIGRPLSDLRLVLLETGLEPVPRGGVGEIHVGGPGLARGYLGRPDLTAERFVPDPWGSPGSRLYRSGDLARLTSFGELEFLGRADQQVKIRGFRIEPGEIEAALDSHPEVRSSAVLASRDASGEGILVACVVPRTGAGPDGAVLRAFLRERVPSYMVPALFVRIPELPLTVNGKLDRAALLQAAGAAPAVGTEAGRGAEPRTQTEAVLAGIWEELLGRSGVGPDDHFFDLGGHSLLASRVASRVREVFGVGLPLYRVFEHPTLAELAGQVEAALQSGEAFRTPPVVPVSRQEELPLSFGQQRLWFVDRLRPGDSSYDIALPLRLEGDLDPAALEAALSELLRRHEALRSSFHELDGHPFQVVHPPVPWVLPRIDLSALPVAERETAARELARWHAAWRFDLARSPLLANALVLLGEGEHELLLTVHHIACDGRSIEILVEELGSLYGAFREGRPAGLPEPPVQYADFAVWQRRWLQGPALDAQLAYWRQRLAGAPPLLALPTDRPRPAVQTFRGASLERPIPGVLAGLRQVCRREQATLFMGLLAAFQALLRRHAGVDDLVVGAPVAGRERPEIERVVGFFANTLVFRTGLDGNPTFRQILSRVRETALGAFAHQDVPFDRLVEELQPVRDPGFSPLVQVAFSFLDQGESPPSERAGGLRLRPVEAATEAAQYELSLTAREAGGELSGFWLYDRDLFDGWRIEQMAEELQHLLELATEDPDQDLTTLDAALTERGRRAAAAREQERKRGNVQRLSRIRRKPPAGEPGFPEGTEA